MACTNCGEETMCVTALDYCISCGLLRVPGRAPTFRSFSGTS